MTEGIGISPITVGREVELNQGIALVVAGKEVEVEGGAVALALGSEVEVEEAAAGAVVAAKAEVENGFVGLLVSGRTHLSGEARVLMTLKHVILLGALAALASGRFGDDRSRRRGWRR